MFEVLMFLFENYMDANVSLKADHETIMTELEKSGFIALKSIGLDWIDGLIRMKTAVQAGPALTLFAYATICQKKEGAAWHRRNRIVVISRAAWYFGSYDA